MIKVPDDQIFTEKLINNLEHMFKLGLISAIDNTYAHIKSCLEVKINFLIFAIYQIHFKTTSIFFWNARNFNSAKTWGSDFIIIWQVLEI